MTQTLLGLTQHELDIDHLRDVYMTTSQRVALDRIISSHAKLLDEVKSLYGGDISYSADDGETWHESPLDTEIVDGLSVGDTVVLAVGRNSVRCTYRVTKAPDETSDDYGVEFVGLADKVVADRLLAVIDPARKPDLQVHAEDADQPATHGRHRQGQPAHLRRPGHRLTQAPHMRGSSFPTP